MKASPIEHDPSPDLFRSELKSIINLRHELCQLSEHIDWQRLDNEFGKFFPSPTGTEATPTRLIAGLFYLKATYHVSDEDLLPRWVENPYWQYFCGEQYLQHQFPIDRTTLSKWRNRLKEGDLEKLLSETIQVGLKTDVIREEDLEKVSVDTTVQEKAITHPTDAKLYYTAREKLVKLAKEKELRLRQTYVRLAKVALCRVQGYGHAKQMKRMRKEVKKLKTHLGRVYRDVGRQLEKRPELKETFSEALGLVERLLNQKKGDKRKLYSLHAPEVECISKGKAHKRYEFGVKVSFVTPQARNFVIGAQALHGNPYDGHTLVGALNQAEKLTGKRPTESYVDLGYRGHGETESEVMISRQKRSYKTRALKKAMRRRSAIEPMIGHMKSDHHLGRNYLKGKEGDKQNAIFSAIGYNLRVVLKKLRLLLVQILLRLFGKILNANLETNAIAATAVSG